MQLTNNFGLQKPEQNDTFDISILNTNMDIVDEELQKIKILLDKLGVVYITESEPMDENGWSWRKFSDGTFEAWYEKNYGTIDFSTAVVSSRLYKDSNSTYYPLTLKPPFTFSNIDHVSGNWKNGSWCIHVIYNYTTSVGIYVGNLISGSTGNNECYLYIKGRL